MTDNKRVKQGFSMLTYAPTALDRSYRHNEALLSLSCCPSLRGSRLESFPRFSVSRAR